MNDYLYGNVVSFGDDGDLIIFNIDDIKRLFYIRNVPKGETRGGHAHKECVQYISCILGSFKLELTFKKGETKTFILNSPDVIVKVDPKIWVNMSDFASGTVALVMATHNYDPNDYIYDINEIF